MYEIFNERCKHIMHNHEQCKRRQKVGAFCTAHSKKHLDDVNANHDQTIDKKLRLAYEDNLMDLYGTTFNRDTSDDEDFL